MSSDKHKVYYVVIVGHSAADHRLLRQVLNNMLPQAIVESLYLNEETLSFLAQHCAAPDLIFLQDEHEDASSATLLDLLKTQADLRNVPVIVVGDYPEEKFDYAGKKKMAYFNRRFLQNSKEWLARMLMMKYSTLLS